MYDAFLREYEFPKIAMALGTTRKSLEEWIEKFPELKLARRMAEEKRGSSNTLADYVFKQLSKAAQDIWGQIEFYLDNESSYQRVNTILSGQPTRLRQEIFIHALVSNSFNLSEACTVACIPRSTLEAWKRDDLEFRQLVEEIGWHKKNFFEGKLTDLVAIGNPGAVMFVNRTVNADRGYSERVQVEHTGTVSTGVDIEELDLDIETRRKILEAIRRKKLKDTAVDIEELKPANGILFGKMDPRQIEAVSV